MSGRISISLICLFLWVSAAGAAGEGISDIIVSYNNNNLHVSAINRGGFTPEIKNEIISGISREFFYYIILHRVIPRWMDEEKFSITIKNTVKYDTLKNQYLVTRSIGDSREERVFDSYGDMVNWVSRIDRVSLAPLTALGENRQYYVSIKAEIKAGELPFLLRYLLFFIPYSEFSTEWSHSYRFMLKDLNIITER